MSRRRVRLYLSLILSLSLLLLWSYMEPEQRRQAQLTALTGEADSYANGIELHQYGDSGQIQHLITATRFEHRTDSDSHLFNLPKLTLYRDQGAPIGAEALTGELESGNEVFWLRSQAQVYNKLDMRYRLETDYLKVLPNDKRAETDAQVMIYQPGGSTKGQGMTAHFDERKIQLHNAVRGDYEPSQ